MRVWIALLILVMGVVACRDHEDSTSPTASSSPPTVAEPSGEEQPEPADQAAPAGEVEGTTASPATLPVPDLGYNAREGRSLFRYYCATCHGNEGHGDGFNAYNLDPKPRDLADATFQGQRSDEDLLAVIRSGGGATGLSTGMPPWGRTLNERQIGNLVIYVRTLPEKSQQ